MPNRRLSIVLCAAIAACSPAATPGPTAPPVPATPTPPPPTAEPRAAPTPPPQPTPAIRGLAGRLIFTRAGGTYGDETLFAANIDGSDELQLADDEVC